MRISEVAAATGLSVDTLRFYEKIGLIDPPPRDGAGRRVYDDAVLAWIRFIGQLNATGMKQADRVRYARLRAAGDSTLRARREMLEAHREVMRAQMVTLQEMLQLLDQKVDFYRELEGRTKNV